MSRTPALDGIDRVARGVSSGTIFICDNNTFKHFMTALFHSELADLSRYQHWEVIGFKEMQQRCNEKAKKILSDHPVTSTSETVLAGIAEILDRQETLGN